MSDHCNKYRLVFDNMPEGAFLLDSEGKLLDVNPAALAILGLSRSQFLDPASRPPGWHIVNETGTPLADEQLPFITAIKSGEQVCGFVAGIVNPLKGRCIWIEITATPLPREGTADLYETLVTFHDISDRKETEEEISGQFERSLLQDILNATDVMLVYLDRDFNFLAVNNAYAHTCRMNAADMVGKNHFVLYPDEENETIFRQVRDTGVPAFFADKPFIFPDQPERGVIYWDWSLAPVFDENQTVIGLVFSLRETTIFRQAEIAMLENTRNLNLALAAARAGTFDWDLSNDELKWSKELYALFDVDPWKNDIKIEDLYERVHPDDVETAQKQAALAIRDDRELHYDCRVVLPDGSIRWISTMGRPSYDEAGNPIHISGICVDITERKEIEEALIHSEQRALAIINASTEPIMLLDSIGTILMLNEAMARRLKCTVIDDALGDNVFDRLPQPISNARRAKLFEAVNSGLPVRFEDSRNDTYFDNNIYPVIDTSGKVTAVAVFCRDISETRRILDNLAYVNECFSQALSGSEHILYRLNVRKGGYDYLSIALEKITGYQINDFMNNGLEKVRELFHPDDAETVFATIHDHIRTRTSNHVSIELEYRLRRADGSYCWLHDSTTVLVNESAEPDLFFGSAYDITERKEMETALRESEEKYRRFIATANEGIGIADADFRIIYVNDRLTEMLGYSTDEMIGSPVSSLLHETEQMRFATTIKDRKDGTSGPVEYRHLRKDGTTVWLLVSSTPIFADDGSFRGCFAMLTDLTARKEAEAILQQSYDELERRVFERTVALSDANKRIKRMSYELIRAQEGERSRIASELHDQVGQTLLLAKMRLDMLTSELTSDSKRRHANNVLEPLETAIKDIRTLSFGLRPPLLDSAGIVAALEWLCSAIMNTYNLKVSFCSNSNPILLESGKRYTVYQAVRELLINIVKHAGVGSAELILSSDGNLLEVTVADAGVGFDLSSTATLLASGTSMGLYNVLQRVEQVGGTINIDSEAGKGTFIIMRIPLNNDTE